MVNIKCNHDKEQEVVPLENILAHIENHLSGDMNMNRTHNNGELRLENVGQTVELKGWVAKKRNLGALVFIDLRDRYGITQIIINEEMENISKDIKMNIFYMLKELL